MRNFILGATLTTMAALAQQVHVERDLVIAHGGPGGPEQMRMALPVSAGMFMGAEFVFEEKLTKGAPYSADAVTETTQMLADGNRIHRKTTMQVWRDGEGRTRRETTLASIAGFPAAQEARVILIADPVAGVHYELNPATKVARKISLPKGGDASAKQVIMFSSNMGAGAISGAMAGGTAPHHTEVFNHKVEVQSTTRTTTAASAVSEAKTESLGTRTIEGLICEGTRTTSTMPAGIIGNDRPIDMTSERWFSKELNTTVLTKRNDPRSGDNVFALSGVRRAEPAKSLFEVPGDYKIEDMKMNYTIRHKEATKQ